MAKYKMKYFGSTEGLKSKKTYHFDKGQEIEAPEGDISKEAGEMTLSDKAMIASEAKAKAEAEAKAKEEAEAKAKAEAATKNPKGESADQKK